MVFVDLFTEGGSTTAAVTKDTVADESRNKMADGVARSPSRLCSRDWKICDYGHALSTIFVLAFVPCFLHFAFLFFPFLFFPASRYVYLLRVPSCSSHLLLSARTYFIVRVLSACVICTLPHLELLCFYSFSFFFVALISRAALFLLCPRTRYASPWLAYVDSLATFVFFSVSLAVTTEFVSL